jgi:hypothetical protein
MAISVLCTRLPSAEPCQMLFMVCHVSASHVTSRTLTLAPSKPGRLSHSLPSTQADPPRLLEPVRRGEFGAAAQSGVVFPHLGEIGSMGQQNCSPNAPRPLKRSSVFVLKDSSRAMTSRHTSRVTPVSALHHPHLSTKHERTKSLPRATHQRRVCFCWTGDVRDGHIYCKHGQGYQEEKGAELPKLAPKIPKAPPPPLPQDPLERAIVTFEADAAFSDDETIDIIDVFMAAHLSHEEPQSTINLTSPSSDRIQLA